MQQCKLSTGDRSSIRCRPRSCPPTKRKADDSLDYLAVCKRVRENKMYDVPDVYGRAFEVSQGLGVVARRKIATIRELLLQRWERNLD